MKKWMIALMMAALLIVPMGGIAYAVGEERPPPRLPGNSYPATCPPRAAPWMPWWPLSTPW